MIEHQNEVVNVQNLIKKPNHEPKKSHHGKHPQHPAKYNNYLLNSTLSVWSNLSAIKTFIGNAKE